MLSKRLAQLACRQGPAVTRRAVAACYMSSSSAARPKTRMASLSAAAVGLTAALVQHYVTPSPEARREAAPSAVAMAVVDVTASQTDENDQELPVFTQHEVHAHKTPQDRIWVSYDGYVYDVTDFVSMHPGGPRIMLAAGGALEPFWAMYAAHKKPNVLELLAQYRIGRLSPEDAQANASPSGDDPYANEPFRHPALIVVSDKPFNAETPASLLTDHVITPNELFFVRNHLPVPVVDEKTYRLTVSGEAASGIKTVELSLDDLRTKFAQYTVTSTIQCAGNRRDEQNKVKQVKGLEWGGGAISNASWTGVRLRDVLQYAGMKEIATDDDGTQAASSPHARTVADGGPGCDTCGRRDPHVHHIQFEGLDRDFERNYGASIPVEKAMDPRGDVLLALEMNGAPIPRDHGFPVRAIVPGVVGARNVKWVSRVHASVEESHSHWQRHDYKGFSSSVDMASVDYDSAPSIQELPVQSCMCSPVEGEQVETETQTDAETGVETETIAVRGYAWSGGGKGIARVDVSADAGAHWTTATLQVYGDADSAKDDTDELVWQRRKTQQFGRKWSWTLWHADVPVPKNADSAVTIVCKAVDHSYNTQPSDTAAVWNVRGVLSNAWHRVTINLPPADADSTD